MPVGCASTSTSERSTSRSTTSSAAARGTSSAASTCSSRAERRPGGERRQRPQPALVVGEEQVVAPGQRRGEGAATLGSACGGVGEQREAVVEPPQDLGHAEHPRAGGGQLDRQREAVERAAERRGRPARCAAAAVGARGEQGDGVVVGQRRQREGLLAVDAERPLAGGEHPHPGRGVEHLRHRIARRRRPGARSCPARAAGRRPRSPAIPVWPGRASASAVGSSSAVRTPSSRTSHVPSGAAVRARPRRRGASCPPRRARRP